MASVLLHWLVVFLEVSVLQTPRPATVLQESLGPFGPEVSVPGVSPRVSPKEVVGESVECLASGSGVSKKCPETVPRVSRDGVLRELLGKEFVLHVLGTNKRTSAFSSTSLSTPLVVGTCPSTFPSAFGGLGVGHFCKGERSLVKTIQNHKEPRHSGKRSE